MAQTRLTPVRAQTKNPAPLLLTFVGPQQASNEKSSSPKAKGHQEKKYNRSLLDRAISCSTLPLYHQPLKSFSCSLLQDSRILEKPKPSLPQTPKLPQPAPSKIPKIEFKTREEMAQKLTAETSIKFINKTLASISKLQAKLESTCPSDEILTGGTQSRSLYQYVGSIVGKAIDNPWTLNASIRENLKNWLQENLAKEILTNLQALKLAVPVVFKEFDLPENFIESLLEQDFLKTPTNQPSGKKRAMTAEEKQEFTQYITTNLAIPQATQQTYDFLQEHINQLVADEKITSEESEYFLNLFEENGQNFKDAEEILEDAMNSKNKLTLIKVLAS